MKFTKYIFTFLFLLTLPFLNAVGQIIPVLEEVSIVDGSSGNVKLKWRHETPSNVYIFRNSREINAWVIIDSVNNYSVLEYIDNSANATSINRIYKLRSTKESPDSKKFSTTFLSSTYDSCRAEINLTWSNSIPNFQYQPDVVFINYEIYLKEGTGSFINIDSTTEQNYTITGIKEKTNYSFYIAAIPGHAPNSKSTSNTITFYSETAKTPAFINPRVASVNSDIVHLEFDVDPNSELTKYKLLRSTSISGTFDTIQWITETQKLISVNDLDADPNKKVYYYKLVALNNCNTPVKESEIINTIFLTAKNSDNINEIEWTPFYVSSLLNYTYSIFRSIGNEPAQQIATVNANTYQDNIEDLIGTNAGSKICYFVYVLIFNVGYNNSNIDCAFLEPKIYIPEAFTPNGDGNNDFFDIKFSFLPSDYTLLIYNRWSNVVFESTNPEDDWDGRSVSGKAVPSGAYIYYLKIVTDTKQTIEKRGNITVIYP